MSNKKYIRRVLVVNQRLNKISELEETAIEVIQNETHTHTKIENEQGISELWENF